MILQLDSSRLWSADGTHGITPISALVDKKYTPQTAPSVHPIPIPRRSSASVERRSPDTNAFGTITRPADSLHHRKCVSARARERVHVKVTRPPTGCVPSCTNMRNMVTHAHTCHAERHVHSEGCASRHRRSSSFLL